MLDFMVDFPTAETHLSSAVRSEINCCECLIVDGFQPFTVHVDFISVAYSHFGGRTCLAGSVQGLSV